MNGRLLRFLPARLLRRLGYHLALHDPAALAAVLETNLDAARAARPADLRRALARSTSPLEFQPGLVGLHRETADIVVYLCNAAAASETNLDLRDPDQRQLYQDLLAAVGAAVELRLRVAAAASRALPASAESAAELQHS
ncbi:hypothetical protein J5Y04_31295 [Kitasatospora sp. RG8]|uniref:hypothetical protein n=1 Tax=Kitasatospora sp. RG8 TaxID=2820815 RepID=UPI001AE0D3C1|nr:hypothetical protein [Kitasatospora sp. RG8]MBP0453994.1 hypothetical protein [Kitasatospora sp. RG8]